MFRVRTSCPVGPRFLSLLWGILEKFRLKPKIGQFNNNIQFITVYIVDETVAAFEYVHIILSDII